MDTTDLSEHHIYGNSRLGVQWYPTGTMRQTYDVNPATPRLTKLTDSTVWFSYPYYDLIKKGQKEPYGQGHTDTMYVSRTLGYRQYEMTDHLGNVLATILDRKTGIDTASADTIAFYNPDIASSQDYYPFGMRMGERHSEINDTIYRFGFNGQEKDNEKYGTFKHYTFTFRAYDPRLGKFLSIDPLVKSYPWSSPYAFAENDVIRSVDLEGLEKYIVTGRSFIPQSSLSHPTNPFRSFAGDNRTSYELNSTSFRTEQKVVVDFDQNKVNYTNNTASGTTMYDGKGNVVRTSNPGKAGSISREIPTTAKPTSETIYLKVDAANKLFSGAPAINYDLAVTITPNEDGSFNYRVKGSTDGFPAYELWITDETNNKSYLLFNRSPLESNEGPGSLWPPMEHSYDLQGSSNNRSSETSVPFSSRPNSPEQ